MYQETEHTVLNHLIEVCRDGERGFALAADEAKDPELKGLFSRLSLQRAAFAKELLPHANRLGGDGPRDGTTVAAFHRGLMALEAALRHSDRVVVGEVLVGNNAAMGAYTEALEAMLPPDTREIVERQYAAIQEAHESIPRSPE